MAEESSVNKHGISLGFSAFFVGLAFQGIEFVLGSNFTPLSPDMVEGGGRQLCPPLLRATAAWFLASTAGHLRRDMYWMTDRETVEVVLHCPDEDATRYRFRASLWIQELSTKQGF